MRVRAAVILVALAVVAAGCGSRLTEEERVAALGGGRAGGGLAAGEPGSEFGFEEGAIDGEAGEAGVIDGGGGAGGGGGGAGGGGGGGGAAGRPPAAPAGGNGGATDVGVTGTEIKVAVLTDRTGPVPGIFEPSVRAMEAWAQYVNSQGGIHGRKIRVLPIDSRTSDDGNRAGAIQACKEAFAVVGSMSAYDGGGAAEIQKCGIPDIPATTVNPPRGRVPNTFPAYPNVAEWYILGPKQWVKDNAPDVIDKGAMMWLNAPVARFNAQKNMQAAKSIGYQFPYSRQVEVVEPNYAPYVTQMRSNNIQYVSMVGDDNSAGRLLRAFHQQNYIPKIREFDTVIYNAKFLEQYADVAEGVLTSTTTVPFHEAGNNAEYQLYINWLRRTAGGQPDYFFGIYAWSAGRLFQHAIERTGPRITRQGVNQFLSGVHEWNGHGAHAAHDPGNRKPGNCHVLLEVRGGKFARKHPASGFACGSPPLYRVDVAAAGG